MSNIEKRGPQDLGSLVKALESERGTSTENKEKVIEELKGDPLIQKVLVSLGLKDEVLSQYLSLFLSYQEDASYCQKCPGLEACHKEMPKTCMQIVYADQVVSRTYGPCPKYLALETIRQGYLYRDYPDEWLSLTPRSLTPKTQRSAKVMAFFKNALEDKVHPWVYLQGEEGSGRSYFLAAFGNLLVSQGAKVAFINANKRFDELKGYAIKDKDVFATQMKSLEECDLLIIDDFGSEYKSDYLRDQIVMPLLMERSKNHRLTFFASDYSLDDVTSLYANNRNATIVARQLKNLIASNCNGSLYLEKGFENYL